MFIVLCQYVQARIKKHDTTIRRRVYFSIKGNNVFTSNSIGNFAVLLDPRMMFLFIWKLAKLTYKIIRIVIFYANVWSYLANLDVNKNVTIIIWSLYIFVYVGILFVYILNYYYCYYYEKYIYSMFIYGYQIIIL